jgi:hypothetical protein
MDSSIPQPVDVIIPWLCLQDQTVKAPTAATSAPAVKISFSEAVSNVCDIPMSQLPLPVVKGDNIAITIPETEYQTGLSTCKHNMQGRVIWPKGTTPLKVGDLKAKLSPLWKSLGKWGITSLGKGFYKLCFSSLEDAQSVRSTGSWNLNPGILKLFSWTKDFNPNAQHISTAQVWLRIYGLSQEYWRQKILFAIASGVGTPICTDHLTNKPQFDREFGHLVRVLVDLDLKKKPIYRVLVERVGFAFFVYIEYENMPQFCHYCNVIGHDQGHCKRANPEKAKNDEELQNKTSVQIQAIKKTYAVAKDNRKQPVTDPVLEVINLEGSTSKTKPISDPLLESILMNKDNILNQVDDLKISNKEQHVSPNFNQQIDLSNVDDTSSEDSEFVDATQIEQEETEKIDQIATTSKHHAPTAAHVVPTTTSPLNLSPTIPLDEPFDDILVTPERALKDMQFLKISWANLAEQENEDIVNNEVLDSNLEDVTPVSNQFELLDEDPPFQVVTKKKGKKANSMASNKTYSTRSKGDHLNLGK